MQLVLSPPALQLDTHVLLQIVSVGSQYNYGGSDQGEFLVVVSRDVSDIQRNTSPTEQTDGKARVWH